MGDEQLYEELLNFYSIIVLLIDEALKLIDGHKEEKELTQGEKEIWKKLTLEFEQIKINLFIDRNNVIFRHSYYGQKGRKSTPQTLAKLLSNTINLYGQFIEQEKAKTDSMEGKMIQIIDAKIFFIRTIRLMLVGQVYFNNEKIKEAYGLWNECERCIKIISNNEHTTEEPLIEVTKLMEGVRVGKLKCVLKHSEQS